MSETGFRGTGPAGVGEGYSEGNSTLVELCTMEPTMVVVSKTKRLTGVTKSLKINVACSTDREFVIDDSDLLIWFCLLIKKKSEKKTIRISEIHGWPK